MGKRRPAAPSFPAPEVHAKVVYRVRPVFGSCPKDAVYCVFGDLQKLLEVGRRVE